MGRPKQPVEILAVGDNPATPPVRGSPQLVNTASGEQLLLFGAAPSDGLKIMIQSVNGGDPYEITEGDRPILAATGHLFFERGPDVWAMPFSPDDVRRDRQAFPVVEGASSPSVSDDGVLIYADPAILTQNQLVWRDRKGRVIEALGQLQQNLGNPSLSPEAWRVAYDAGDGRDDVWVYDIATDTRTRLTAPPSNDSRAAWSHDGQFVVFRSDRTGNLDLFQTRADGGGDAERLVGTEVVESGPHWSSDGRYMVYHASGEEPGRWIHYLRRIGDGTELELAQFSEEQGAQPKLSPNGRFVAYESRDTEPPEIVVRSFPTGDSRWMISTNGGVEARWRADGGELFFFEGNTLMTVPVSTEGSFSRGRSSPLFEDPSPVSNLAVPRYDVAPDGQRFLMVQRIGDGRDKTRSIHVVQNWHAGVGDRE